MARGEEIPIGTKVASVEARDTYGLINSPCNTSIPTVWSNYPHGFGVVDINSGSTDTASVNDLNPNFGVFNASLDGAYTVSFNDFEIEQGLDPSVAGWGTRDFAEDKDGNTLSDGIDRYPQFLATILDGVRPLARVAGVTPIAGVPVLLQLLIFPPDTRLVLPHGEAARLIADNAQAGYPVLIVIQDFHAPDRVREPGPITDYCTPRQGSITFLPESDPPLLVNPQAGSYAFKSVALSKRDADNDGIENSLDTCPLGASAGDPRVLFSGDADDDGLDTACDPNDDPLSGGRNIDQDSDGYLNRQDNCPFVPNGQTIGSSGIFIDSPTNQPDKDVDDIGDVCDPNPESPDGEAIIAVKHAEVIVGDASGSGGPPNAAACAHCYRPGGRAGRGGD